MAPTNTPPVQAQTYADFLRNTIAKGKYMLHNKSFFGGATEKLTFTRETDFFNILIHLLNSQLLSTECTNSLALTCSGCHRFITTFLDYQRHPRDITVLHHPTVPRHQLVEAFTQLAFAANLDIPVLLSCLRGEYSGDYRDPYQVISILSKHGCPANLIADMQRVLTVGAPATFQASSTRSNFLEFLQYGNH
jgi:hypothetical protein